VLLLVPQVNDVVYLEAFARVPSSLVLPSHEPMVVRVRWAGGVLSLGHPAHQTSMLIMLTMLMTIIMMISITPAPLPPRWRPWPRRGQVTGLTSGVVSD
jgi:hypothetical protein